ncbi:DUF192 domain-containing protein [Streptomyces sp. NBC_00257]|uniref:DUF192 domain-containing protein n=1 Tax=unclassified Streptomyces TaxID=2593676 RepID=UPI002254DABD|nr:MULTISPECIES: DUF192 domain-containing protein [unclassified Streptomyces]WSW05661.1 DUF192 domain-containing protein [Streptomyces sp. NBC_01005]WTB56476.1 DUF192 domain-containing protein [Streptomyces sp. NBC_00826]WTC95164.1 DUF192 domain-containing protein [Streptomyces sp. NBC_01650]WTH90641.1 DUF192 domain-containing protein [Streptomyces sp. NBC_00825]WTH99367.1 DUF192 domain-containing protein [Streptomyces sp. NBC_00822]
MAMAQWRNGTGTLTVTDAQGGQEEAIPLRIAASYRARSRGLLGQDGIDGALMITPCGSVHSFRMRFTIDVAYLDRKFKVVAVHTMKPGRLGMPRLRARHVIEAEAGAMEKWGIRPGARVTIVQSEVDGK